MSTTSQTTTESPQQPPSIPDDFTVEALRNTAGITTVPAEKIVNEFESWNELYQTIVDEDDSLEDIKGVGKATAESLTCLEDALEDAVGPQNQLTEDQSAEEEPSSPDNAAEKTADNSSDDTGTDQGPDSEFATGKRCAPKTFPETLSATLDAGVFTAFIMAASQVLHEAQVQVHPEGLYIRGVDPANVAMVDLVLPESEFDDLNAVAGTVGMNMEKFTGVLKQLDSDSSLTIERTENQGLLLESEGLEFTLGLIDVDSMTDVPDIPEFEIEAECTINQSDLKKAVTATDMVAEQATVTATPDETILIGAQGDTDEVEKELATDDVVVNADEDVTVMYALEYLRQFRRVFSDANEVAIEFADDMPLSLEGELKDGAIEAGGLLAPRIQAE